MTNQDALYMSTVLLNGKIIQYIAYRIKKVWLKAVDWALRGRRHPGKVEAPLGGGGSHPLGSRAVGGRGCAAGGRWQRVPRGLAGARRASVGEAGGPESHWCARARPYAGGRGPGRRSSLGGRDGSRGSCLAGGGSAGETGMSAPLCSLNPVAAAAAGEVCADQRSLSGRGVAGGGARRSPAGGDRGARGAPRRGMEGFLR
ncbi:glycine-rich cell wall structural protein 1.0-like [Dipodomys spectabilis]|uniref:glycine-rich cell wall structural protein 1.0-like n=1 Tax=Dipodomys spectabilis TaxID=105255 RepID=UPI001C53F572|nr:glycine-rich cell wall structural protein 1.0-like [Dipodomys spectabilis]